VSELHDAQGPIYDQATKEELAKAVARQILDALLYYHQVHGRCTAMSSRKIFCAEAMAFSNCQTSMSRELHALRWE